MSKKILSEGPWLVEQHSEEAPCLIRFRHKKNKKVTLDEYALWDPVTWCWGPMKWRPLPHQVNHSIIWKVENEMRHRSV